MVKVKHVPPPYVTVFDPYGDAHTLNEYQFLDLRVQIMNEGAEGWSALCETGVICAIDKDGRLSHYPKQFDLMEKYLFELVVSK
jgi:hypothetical protein